MAIILSPREEEERLVVRISESNYKSEIESNSIKMTAMVNIPSVAATNHTDDEQQHQQQLPQQQNKKFNDLDLNEVATAYRAACEADSELILKQNIKTNYYLLPATWMNHFIESVASDSNLCGGDEKKDGNEEEEIVNQKQIPSIENKSLTSDSSRNTFSGVSIADGLSHGKDFALVGSNAWKVLQRFGFDVAIPRPVVSLGQSYAVEVYSRKSPHSIGTMAIVPLPLSGRWELARTSGISLQQESTVADTTDDLFTDVDNSPNENKGPILLLPPPDPTPSTALNNCPSLVSSRQFRHTEPSRKKPRQNGRCGLGNLGNTCFMNSTLQCLAHTDPLRQYFLSGAYREDLNKSNPLGTGGELATEFARLLEEMWSGNCYYDSVVYPRSFKLTLGRHADQFVGYDQHDSQELATYLLDALHEDTNRVTKKPYFEKPEQDVNESDEEAARKAWELHLSREDSKVLQAFMGQVKSRVESRVVGCNRVSTTFDPFMFLSVPIPGATDRVMAIIFVPLDPKLEVKKIHVTVSKTSNVSSLCEKIVEAVDIEGLQKEDICIADVWNFDIYTIFSPTDDVSKIREPDQTYAYQLTAVADIHRQESSGDTKHYKPLENDLSHGGLVDQLEHTDEELDANTKLKLTQNESWIQTMEKYLLNSTSLNALINPKRTNHDERIDFLNKLHKFVQQCSSCVDARFEKQSDQVDTDESDYERTLAEISHQSPYFRNVDSRKDLLILNYCSILFYDHVMKLSNEASERNKDGILVQIAMKKELSMTGAVEKVFATPLVMRISSRLTVFGFRHAVGKRLQRVLHPSAKDVVSSNTMKVSDPTAVVGMSDDSLSDESINDVDMEDGTSSDKIEIEPNKRLDKAYASKDDIETMIMRRIPLSFSKRSSYNYSTHSNNRVLGSLQRNLMNNEEKSQLANPEAKAEQDSVAELVGNQGTIVLHWSLSLADNFLDEDAWERIVEPNINSPSHPLNPANNTKKPITVIDCIKKFCQEEQLEESEMWYCSSCKTHVRAWKQFHLYSTPPILIIHLKRFHYSSSTHRRDKIDTFIDFPLTGLDLRQYVMSWNEGEEPIYDCYAVSNHYGGLGGGHYTAYAMNNSQWCYFDDSRVTEGVRESDVVSSAAYVLYYRRRDVETWDYNQSVTRMNTTNAASVSEESDTNYSSSANGRAVVGDMSQSSSNENNPLIPDKMSHVLENDNMKKMVVAMEGMSNQTCTSPLESVEDDDLGVSGNSLDIYQHSAAPSVREDFSDYQVVGKSGLEEEPNQIFTV